MASVCSALPFRRWLEQRSFTITNFHPGDSSPVADQLLYTSSRYVLLDTHQGPRSEVRFYDGAALGYTFAARVTVRPANVPRGAHLGIEIPSGPQLFCASLEQNLRVEGMRDQYQRDRVPTSCQLATPRRSQKV